MKLLKNLISTLLLCSVFGVITGCSREPKIGVSFGVGPAIRWVQEKNYMEQYAAAQGVQLEARLNRGNTDKTQADDCKELIDSGINVLILIPRVANEVGEILEYARQKKVKVISYARVVLGNTVDLYVGYDNEKIGEEMGKYLIENAYQDGSRYVILQGDPNDNNSNLLYKGAMRKVDTVKDKMVILGDEFVTGWSADNAKTILRSVLNKTIDGKSNVVDAIFASNDIIAGACAEVLEELGTVNSKGKKSFFITGMDAELSAAKRIVGGKQSMTVYMDLQSMAEKAIEQAIRIGKNKKAIVNTKYDNLSGTLVDANLIMGITITKENLDRVLIDSGIFRREQVYDTEF